MLRWAVCRKRKRDDLTPPVRAQTMENVHQMFEDKGFYIPDKGFWDGKNTIAVGEHCLQKSVAGNKNGGEIPFDNILFWDGGHLMYIHF